MSPCDKDFPDAVIGILFICLIVACAGILIFAAFTAMNLPTTADATRWHDGTMYVTVDHPAVNETATFWVSNRANNYTQDTQTIQPILLGDTAFFFYPHNITLGEYVYHNLTYYESVSHNTGYALNYLAENAYQKYVWAKPILALHNTTQTMSQTIIELENKIETLQDKLGKQGKRIQKLETLLFN